MVNTDELIRLYKQYISTYEKDLYTSIWENHSDKFKHFWTDKILSDDTKELNDQEVDDIIRILDKNAKGSTKTTEAIAKAMIPQGAWRRMFNEIKGSKRLSHTINTMITETDWRKKAEAIDELYKLNQGKKNNLTGPSGNAINCFIVAYDPFNNLSVISMNDRRRLLSFLSLDPDNKLAKMSFGEQVAWSNKLILDEFRRIGINESARIISDFLYDSHEMKQLWKPEEKPEVREKDPTGRKVFPATESLAERPDTDRALFYMEEQLEDFLIENWERPELSKKYDLIEEDGELVSQQYKTGIGKIDILVKEKNTNNFVVIELKKGQTSDDTVGQLARYMGWIKEKKNNGKLPKGIIIAGRYDERLYYASKVLPDVKIYLYNVDFKLDQFVQGK